MTSHAVRLMQRLLFCCASGSLLGWVGASPPALEADGATLQRLEQSVREQAARLEARSSAAR
jgi:hypothetical protein